MAALKKVGDIRIFAEIHQGATTTVYKGFQQSQNRIVLLKVLRPEFAQDNKLLERFQKEAKVIAKIHHPNVVAIYEAGRFEEWSYFAAEFVEGLDLSELIGQRKLPPDLAWFILLEAAKGLRAAHDKNILHKDIKPSNILISHGGKVKLVDFGLADLRQSSKTESVDEIKGTLGYFSPEQILGETQGKYSDLFSLGATFYEMLSGTPAFYGKSTSDRFKAILNDDPIQYLNKDPQIPSRLIEICQKMLIKKSSGRYQNCDGLLKDLESFRRQQKFSVSSIELASYIKDPKSYSPKTFKTVSEKVERRFNYRAYSSVSFAIVLVSLLGYYTLFSSKKNENPANSNFIKAKPSLPEETSLNNSVPVEDVLVPRNDRISPQNQAGKAENSVLTEAVITDRFVGDSLKLQNAKANPVGYLTLKCTPWAYVFVDGDSIGMTPLRDSLQLAGGFHEILFRNPDFPEHKTTIEIQNDDLLSYEFSLWSLVGKLNLEISPWAEVFINGEYRDTIPPQERPLLLKPGEHKLTLKHPVLGNWETTIKIRAEQNLNLQFNLKSLLSK